MQVWRISLFCLLFQFAFILNVDNVWSDSRQMQDQAGRVVQVPENPERVVSLAPSITEMVYALGREDLLAGVTRYSDYPPQAQDLPVVGSYKKLDVERIVQLRPDLCLATKDGNPISTVNRLESLGVPVFALDPHDMQQVMQTLRQLGQLLQARAAAEEVIFAMQARLAVLQNIAEQSQDTPKVFFQIGRRPLVAAGKNTFIDELITLAGGKNLASGSNAYPRYSRENVLQLDPDVILISSMDYDQQAAQETVEAWKRYPGITAVAEERIHVLPAELFNRPSPRMLDALEILVNVLHVNDQEQQ